MTTAGELGEDGLIELLCRGLASSEQVVIGPGDDCAVVGKGRELTLLKTDAVVSGIHFRPDEDPLRVGWKAVARVLSDFAAMGGEPGELLVTLAMEGEVEIDWVKKLYAGMQRCLDRFGGVIVGGETSSLPSGSPMVISVAGRGRVKRKHLVTRSGGCPGDFLYVTGRLGGSLRGKHLDFEPRLKESEWLVANHKITAMMDLSDGLAKDLPRLAKMSGLGFTVDQGSIPIADGVAVTEALGDGEDYELLFATCNEIGGDWKRAFPGLELTRIGRLVEGQGDQLTGGWDHFR